MERKVITRFDAEKLIGEYMEKTAQQMRAHGLEPRPTPYAAKAREERFKLLYELLESSPYYEIRDC